MAINQFTHPAQAAVGSKIPITLPIGSAEAFAQLSQLTLVVQSDDGTVNDQFVFGRNETDTSNKNLVLLSETAGGEQSVQIGRARYIDNTTNKRIEIEVSDIPEGAYDLSGTLIWSNMVFAIPASELQIGDVVLKSDSFDVAVPFMSESDEPEPIRRVSLVEPNREETGDQEMWVYIRNGVVDFNKYQRFIDNVMTLDNEGLSTMPGKSLQRGRSPLFRTDAYAFLKQATDYYLTEYFSTEDDGSPSGSISNTFQESRATPDEIANERRRTRRVGDLSVQPGNDVIPYFQQVLNRLPDVLPRTTFPQNGFGSQLSPSLSPFSVPNLTLLELIWSYWHEEGGLVQTLNAISLRFQNVRSGNGSDPLAGLNIDPLRPLNNLIWGYIQDERFRLSLAQRNFEYQYEYGLSLIGRAVPNIAVAESRSQFIPAFHNLLKAATDFYLQANYTTVIPDGFPILNHLREVHLLLAEGSHNSFRDLPYTARAEMLTQQWILGRPEMREFLGGRIMVPYTESWMDRVDTMKTLQGWNPANITHFHDLGRFGEQLLLSVRYGAWNSPGTGAVNAANWAHYWREEIQRYLHAYKAVTGVDLAADVTDARISMPEQNERYEQPAVLINRRLNTLPAGQSQLGFGILTRQRALRETR